MSADTGFGWRTIDAGQVPAWASLIAAIEAVDHPDEDLGEEYLLEEFADPRHDFARGSVAVYDGPVMIGYCVLTSRSTADPVHEMRQSGGVHPAYRGRGIGSALLDWAQRAAVPIHAELHAGQPLSLGGRCLARLDDAVALLLANGYQQARWFRRMVADLTDGVEERPAPADVEIVRFTAERSNDALLVRNEAFRDHWGSAEQTEESWAHFIGYHAFRSSYSFLAYAGAEPLGVVLGHEYEEYNRVSGRRDLYIPLVGTRRAGRRRGIASALVTRALRTARADGFDTATLDVDADSATGALNLYERIGFAVHDTWIVHTKPLIA